MKLEHEHPFTLIENSGQLLCPECGEHLDESYCCKCDMGSKHYECSLCLEQLSGSCYTCKLCWPGSPIAHHSCFELPEKFQITYRPGCFFHFEDESSEQYCDFCEKKQRCFKCGDCDFQIGVSCASKLIKYHEGQQHVDDFSHRHPLTLLKLDHMACKLCLKSIDSPDYGYGCAPCNFYIHNSCLGFPQEISHPFHPRHCLTLVDEERESMCDGCCFHIQGSRYRCKQYCQIELHPDCTYLKPNIKYTGHDHLLILIENLSYKGECQSCGFDIEGVFFMRCVQCHLNFHVHCGSQSLPPTVWHKEHEHPLISNFEKITKEDSRLFYCSFCHEEINDEVPFYSCEDCEYFSHVRCAITEVEYDDNEKLSHFSHNHVLILREIYKNDDVSCCGCGKAIIGPGYGCEPCQFYLHKSCVELPMFIYDHQRHEHHLSLRVSVKSRKSTCDACNKHLDGFIYCCDDCNFNLDLVCAGEHPSVNIILYSDECKYLEDQERIGHFSHRHHLVILEKAGVNCELCHKRIINDQCYGCAQCEFYIHNSCGELLREIRHPFHPSHSLKLAYGKPDFICDACCFEVPELRYRCEECDFDLHPECLSLKVNIEYKGHQHLLILVENMANNEECNACNDSVRGDFFMRCVACMVNFHVQCGPMPLPQTLLHKQHIHLLTLSTGKLGRDNSDQLYCAVCLGERIAEHPTYYCADCRYYAHVRCVITKFQVDEREKVKHFSHKCFLFLLENKSNNDIICVACEKNFEANSVYGCNACEFYLHKSCADLQREIQHPFHRHPLSLPNPYYEEHQRCNACHKRYKGFSYSCRYCDFNLDLQCCLLFPSIKLEPAIHDHTLTFFKQLHDTNECCRCVSERIPPNKFTPIDAYYVRCVKCDYSLHLMCCPLPQTIGHGSHPHPLILGDNFVDLFVGFDDEEYCCDFCEIRRDAGEFVYYCKECSFVVDPECVFIEVIQFLEGKCKDVESRIVSRKRKGNLTCKRIMESVTKEENEKIESLISEVEQKIKEGTLLDFFDELKNNNASTSKETTNVDQEYIEEIVMEVVEGIKKLAYLEEEDSEAELVNVGDYKITPKLAPVLNKLLDKYKDWCSGCPLTQSLKTILIILLCVVIDEMRDTKGKHIDNDKICTWWFYLKIVERAGFRVDFVLDHLKSIAVEVYFLKVNINLISKTPFYKLHDRIDDLFIEIDKRKAEIEKLEKETKDTISSYDSERWRSEAKRYNEAMRFWRTNATSGLLDDDNISKL